MGGRCVQFKTFSIVLDIAKSVEYDAGSDRPGFGPEQQAAAWRDVVEARPPNA
jgi:hypothetical protein